MKSVGGVIRGEHALRIAMGITVLVLLFAGNVDAKTLTVNASGGADYVRIQDSINNASDGDTILVYSGIYHENVNVKKQLILRGIGVPVVNASGSGSAITLSADGIMLEGFTATGAGSYPEAGITVSSKNNTLIRNNAGITLLPSSIRNNITDNSAAYMRIIASDDNSFKGNTIDGSINIALSSSGNSFEDNMVNGGISLDRGQSYYFNGNTFNGDITLYQSSASFYNNTLSSGNITVGRSSGADIIGNKLNSGGIILSSDNIAAANIINNTINSDDIGISSQGSFVSNKILITDNTINSKGIGILIGILGEFEQGIIYNNYINAKTNIKFHYWNYSEKIGTYAWNTTKQSGTNIVGGPYLGGNFWANPNGTGFSQTCADVNSDGICDSYYLLDNNNTDYLPLASIPAAGHVHNINKGTNYTSIQIAINDSSPGDEIHVDSGTYYENVNVNKQLILRGIGVPVVNASGSGSAITLSADGITLMGFTAINGDTGINVASKNNKLIGNIANSNNNIGIKLESSNNTLMGNKASGNNLFGIGLHDSNNNTLNGNNASLNGNTGIDLFSSSNNTLVSNNANSNFWAGIWLIGNSNSLSNNTISNNENGIKVEYSIGNILKDNRIMNNNKGITIDNSKNNLIYDNYFSNINNSIDSGNNIWNTTQTPGTNIVGGYFLSGNFWAQPDGNGYSQKCIDAESDGICDLPYELNSNNTDYLPLSKKPPSISFINPTPANGATISQNYVLLNTTISDSSIAFIDWNRSLIGWWRFNNESGENSAVFRDSSSWGNNGTCSGVNCPSFTSGKFGNALNFDGINDYVDAGNGASLDITDAITIEAWINPAVPLTLKGSYYTAGHSRDVVVQGNYAYMADRDNGLVIIDVSNPAAPTLKGSYDTAGSLLGVAVQGNYAYITAGDNGLAIIDVSNPAVPAFKGSYDTGGDSSGVAVEGSYAYVADGSNGLVIVDVSNPEAPTFKGSYDTAGYSRRVAVEGSYAYVADGSNGLVIIDVSNPTAPTLKSSYDTAGFSYGVAVAGNYAYVADGDNGLAIIDVSNPAQEKCWDGVSGNYGIISKVSAPANSVNYSWTLRYGAPGGGCYLGFDFNGNPEGSRWVTVKQGLIPGEWYHIVGTFNGTDINSYLNGNLKDTNKISAIKGYRNRLLIGNDGWSNLFKGKIDEVRIHRRALSPEEIKASYDAGIYRLYRNFTGLASGSYNYQAYAQNLAGRVNQTETRSLSVSVNPEPSGFVISNIVATSGKVYGQDTLAIGKLFYTDRTYKFTGVPSPYIGLNYIKTSTDDRYRTESNFLQFDVNKNVTVYVAYDDRISPKPSWLTSVFTDTGDNVVRDDSSTFSIYSRNYPAGHISLGGTAIPPGGAGGSYVVIVKPQGSPSPLVVSISESPDPVISNGTSQVTVHVTSGGSNVAGANVGLSSTGGSLSSSTGATDASGNFTVTYTAPSVTTSTTHTISSTASKTGFVSGSGSDLITVNPGSSGLRITNIVAASGKTYVNDTLAIGKLFYFDRTYKFSSVPPSYIGLNYIKTSTDDRYRTESNFLQFDVNKGVTVYVVYDDRISPKPSWLTSFFTDTGDNVVRDDSSKFSIYSRNYPAGHISLGGTKIPSGGAGGSYVVILKPQGSPIPTTLIVSISESPDPVLSGGTSQVTVHVTSGGSNVAGANVGLSSTGGSLGSSTGATDANGNFTVTYTAPSVTASTTYTISATASKTGFASGSGSDLITVNPVSSGLRITNIVAASGKKYVNDTLAIGKLFYFDRTYKFSSVPPLYIGLNYIKTSTDDRYRTESNFLQFDVNKGVTVYVVYDDRISPKPSWLTSFFTDTGDNVVRDDSSKFSIYSRNYPAGHISLGGTKIPSGGAGGSYVVIVK